MQIIYAFPFIVLSGTGFILCILIRSWRKNALQALLLPLGFGGTSVIGGFILVMLAENIAALLHLDSGSDEGKLIMLGWFLVSYTLSGLCGAWVTLVLLKRLHAKPQRDEYNRENID